VLGDELEPGHEPPPRAASARPRPPAAPLPSSDVTSTPYSSRSAGRAARGGPSAARPGPATPLLRAEHGGRVDEAGAHVAGHLELDVRSRAGERSASRAPRPPSVVADPPRPTTIRRAPSSRARSMSSPVPLSMPAAGRCRRARRRAAARWRGPSRSRPCAGPRRHAARPGRRAGRSRRRSGWDRRGRRAAPRRRRTSALVGVVAELPAGAADRRARPRPPSPSRGTCPARRRPSCRAARTHAVRPAPRRVADQVHRVQVGRWHPA
jgi:hypothetical protein